MADHATLAKTHDTPGRPAPAGAEPRTAKQFKHGVLPHATHDELSRQNFVKSFKLHLANKVIPGNRLVYRQIALPQFEKEHGRAPRDRHEVHQVMDHQPYYQFWGALQRTSQEMCWDSVVTSVNRQLPELNARARPKNNPIGSLRLDPELDIPRYLTAIDIHCVPGAYYLETCEGDVAGGAVYDRGGDVYAMGSWGAFGDAKGVRVSNYLRSQFPALKPRRILDLGCTVGHNTLAYVDAFPEAEVYGIDLGAPMLRYAHARAESLRKKVHFSQQNAEKTDFPDGFFDLIVSTVFLHETSSKALPRILRETRRLLRPGGVSLHVERQMFSDVDPYEGFLLDWDTYCNNEPFWSALRENDPKELMTRAGFEPEKFFRTQMSRATSHSRAFQPTTDNSGRSVEVAFGAVR